MVMFPSKDCLELIKESEGLYRKLSNGKVAAYIDPVGVWTIGYGSTFNFDHNRPVQKGDIIDRPTAELWLNQEIDQKAKAVNVLCSVEITQSMFDALVSFIFNLGEGALKRSTLLKKLNSEDYEGAAREFDRWIHGDGKVLPGLVIRRDKEEALFRQDGFPGDDATIPVATAAVTKEYQPVELPLKIQSTLKSGVVNSEDCYVLNCGLAELGYLDTGTQPNSYTAVTEKAVEWFQGEKDLQVDGKFGRETKAALAAAIAKSRKPAPPALERIHCRLTRTKTANSDGLEVLSLEFVSPKGKTLNKLNVVSGAPGRQTFRLLEDGIPGSLEPIPQSRYFIADIEWAGGKDDFSTPHPHPMNGIGPVFVPLVRTVPMRDRERGNAGGRDDFGFHIDWNNSSSPGSAGCVCTSTLADLRELVRLLRLYDPRDLFVDWGLL
ncbi:MAG: glycoside hydrolase family protein [Oscillatoriophycideae cyanobacterium NC_groundwater_1537_Pr4_S-0.65um_50_18]|nr:glycoside hydrolase family protein [Oscillatoriophycideae cyanobacterium NC_groundwater_1537_Pr4_S-0.65um_50_18]